MTLAEIQSTLLLFEYYKGLGEKTFDQLTDEQLFFNADKTSNSIGSIVKHLSGNMLSRWTNFLTEDGEKKWRDRDAEFNNSIQSREELIEKWNDGWTCLFKALLSIRTENLDQEIFIRNQGHSIGEAIQRQLAHYAYHVGQIVFLGKLAQQEDWKSLSIAKGKSKSYNHKKFNDEKRTEHFTKEFKDKKS